VGLGVNQLTKGPEMASNPSAKKRQREVMLRERKREKAAKRAEKVSSEPVHVPEGVDRDLIGIVAGPQPLPEE
jgi:hypothetical protein